MDNSLSVNKRTYLKYLLYGSLVTTNLFNSIRVLYYLKFALDNSQISLLKVVLAFGFILFEIPTGVIADKLSQRVSIMLGTIIFSLHALVYVLYPNFLGFILTQLLLGLSGSFISGADSTYLSSYIKEYDKNASYVEIRGKISAIGRIIGLLLAIISSFIFAINPKLNFILTSIMGLVATYIVYSFPKLNKTIEIRDLSLSRNISIKEIYIEYLNHAKFAFYSLFKDKSILISTVFFSIVVNIIIFNFEYYQVLLKQADFPEIYMGFIYGSFSILAMVGDLIPKYLLKKLHVLNIYVLFSLIIILSFLLMFNGTIINIIIAIILQQIVFSSWGLIFQDDLLKNVTKDEFKSTMLSINSLIGSIFKLILMLILSFMLKLINLKAMYLVLSLLVLISLMVFIIKKKSN